MCSSSMWGSNWSSRSTLFLPPQSTSPLPLSAPARRRARIRSLPLLSFAFCGRHGLLYRRTGESRVALMGQMYSDEDKRGLFSFPSKAGNGKSVPRRNYVLPSVGLCRVGGSCQPLIRDSYSHLRVCAHNPARVFVCGNCQSVCSL